MHQPPEINQESNLITPTFILLVAVILHLFTKLPKARPERKLPPWLSSCPKAGAHHMLNSAMCLITLYSALEFPPIALSS